MLRIVVLLMIGLAASVRSQEPDLYTRLVEAYSKLDTYCDRGEKKTGEKGGGLFSHVEFERCFHRDGRYRAVTRAIEPRTPEGALTRDVEWMSGTEMHRWFGSIDGEHTHEYLRFVPDDTTGGYGGRMALNSLVGEFTDVFNASPHPPLRARLAPFKRVAEAGDEQFEVYEASDDYRSTRIWVSRQDGLIHRSQYLGYPGGEMNVEMRLNAPLADADLGYEPPGTAHLGMWIEEHPRALFWILVAISALMGWSFWLVLSRRCSSEQRWGEIRRGGWKVFAVIAAIMLLLATTSFCSGKPGFSGILDIQRGFALLQLLVIVAAFFAASGLVRFRGKLPAGGNS